MKTRDAAGPDFRALVERVPTEFIRDAPQGKYGKYVSHSDVAQIALARLGRPHDYEVREVVRGLIPPSKTSSGKAYPERPNGVVGVLARLTVRIDDETYTVTEAGEANSPANLLGLGESENGDIGCLQAVLDATRSGPRTLDRTGRQPVHVLA